MKLKNYFGLMGALLVIAGGMSPMLRVPVLGYWNYWDIDLVLASIVFVFAGAGVLSAVFNKNGMLRFCGWGAFLVIVFTLVAVYFKANDYFSFIPFKKLARVLTNTIRYQWTGWAMLGTGAFLMILSGRKEKKVDLAVPDVKQVSVLENDQSSMLITAYISGIVRVP